MKKLVNQTVVLMRKRRVAMLCEEHHKLRQYEEDRLTALIQDKLADIERQLLINNSQYTFDFE